MAKCPLCGTENARLVREWDIQPRRKKGPKVHITLYECVNCKTRFREFKKAE
jgi:DNA-directed RNA polymerase subunit M/transcription elongation factor TFIIS